MARSVFMGFIASIAFVSIWLINQPISNAEIFTTKDSYGYNFQGINYNRESILETDYDVIVIGGGLSGLTTTLRLAQAGLNVILFEALDDIGGRTQSIYIHGNRVSKGGTWSIFENIATLELAGEVNAPPFVPTIIPRQIAIENIAVYPYLLLRLWYDIGFKSSQYSDDFWTWPNASKYDMISVEDWMSEEVDNLVTTNEVTSEWASRSKQAVRDWFWLWENINSTNPMSISSMSALACGQFFYQRTRLLSAEGLYTLGVFRWDNGTGVLTDAIKKYIETKGGKVVMNSPVISIDYTDPVSINVTIQNGTSYTTKRVVVASSLTAASNIIYNPPLPSAHRNLFQSIVPIDSGSVQVFLTWKGLLAKWYFPFSAVLPQPSDQPSVGMYGEIFEVTPLSSTDGVFRIVVVDPVRSYDYVIGPKTGKEALLATQSSSIQWLKDIFGPLYTLPIQNIFNTSVWDWRTQKPYIPGVTYYWPSNGSLVAFGDGLRTPIGNNRIFWAGAERAKHGLNWMEGAVQRGNEAACEVLNSLGKVENCTIYMNWLRYLSNNTLNTLYVPHKLSYTAVMQTLVTNICLIIRKNGFSCPSVTSSILSPIVSLWRLASRNTYENIVHGEIEFALQSLKLAENEAILLGQASSSLFNWIDI